MHALYLQYLNLFIAFEGQEGLKLHDYLWYLQNFDKFDDFALNKKMKHQSKYLAYLKELSAYLEGFVRRAQPLFGLEDFCTNVRQEFESKYSEGRVHGWEPELDVLDESEWQFCSYCEKLYIRERAYIDHLSGKNHLRRLNAKENVNMDDPEIEAAMNSREQVAKKEFKASH
jgi:splicing factor 3A subunit 3